MLLIRPIKLLPSMVIASNAGTADADYLATNSYALGNRVYYALTGKTYECIQAPALGKPPTDPLYWMVANPSNRWAMFDDEYSTATTTVGDLTTTLVVPSRVNASAFFGLLGTQINVTQRSANGAVLATFQKVLRTQSTSWYEYFFGEKEQLSEVVFTGLVPSSGSRIDVVITGPAACAAAVVGNMFFIGDARFGATTSIVDYSKKNTTADGVQSFERGRFSRRMSVTLELPRERYPAVQRALESVRATPCVWIGVPDRDAYAPMTIYGFYRDFSFEVAYSLMHLCSLEIESLT